MDDNTISAPVRVADSTAITATLEEVDIKTELQNRPHRRPIIYPGRDATFVEPDIVSWHTDAGILWRRCPNPTIPLGRRFWPLRGDEKREIPGAVSGPGLVIFSLCSVISWDVIGT
jgi:hypothetical protein